jgi:hypothetical protein
VAVQTIEGLPLRLRILPSLRDIEEDNGNTVDSKKSSRFFKYLRFLGRLSFSQFGMLQLNVISGIKCNVENFFIRLTYRRTSMVARNMDSSRRGGFLRYGSSARKGTSRLAKEHAEGIGSWSGN